MQITAHKHCEVYEVLSQLNKTLKALSLATEISLLLLEIWRNIGAYRKIEKLEMDLTALTRILWE